MSIPILEFQIDKNAQPVMPAQEQAIVGAITAPGSAVTDVVVISHG